jgi:glycosyltransferase involved in cell wall biosynthesis
MIFSEDKSPLSDKVETGPSQLPCLFSIVIPVRNEEENIRKCLHSLVRMKFAPERFEVIVVDNGSTDQTKEVALAFRESLSLRILDKPNAYIAAVRNAGAAVAHGRYLAFLDADCEVRPDWLSVAAEVLSADDAGVCGAFYLIPEGSSWIARHWYQIRESKPAGEVSYVPAGDLFVSRQVLDKIHGFDESIQTNEDYEFCQRIRAAGLPIRCEPRLGVIHWGTPQSLSAFFKKNRWHGMHVFRVFLRNLPALHNFKPVALAMYTLVSVLGVLAGALLGLRSGDFRFLGAFILATLFPAVVLGLHAAISSRRLQSALPMTVLYLAYAFARAWCLVDWRNWVKQSNEPLRSKKVALV